MQAPILGWSTEKYCCHGSCVVHLMAILCVVHLMDFMGCICTTCVARSLKHVGISTYVSHQMRWPDFDVGIHTIRG